MQRKVPRWLLLVALVVTGLLACVSPPEQPARPSPAEPAAGEKSEQGVDTSPSQAPDAHTEKASEDSRRGFQQLWSIPMHQTEDVFSVYLSATGERVALSTYDGRIDVYDRAGNLVAALSVPMGETVPLPGLEVWLSAPWEGSGTLSAWNLSGQMLWETEVPEGLVSVHPEGRLIALSWDGFEGDDPHTILLNFDGQILWQTQAFGGLVSFSDEGTLLVWDDERQRWDLVDAAGNVLKSSLHRPAFAGILARNGQYILYENGKAETLDGQMLFSLPRQDLLATNRWNLHVFAGYPEKRLHAYDDQGQELWSQPSPPRAEGRTLVAERGEVVAVLRPEHMTVYEGRTGQELAYMPGVRKAALSSDGKYLAVAFSDRFSLFERMGP